MGTLENDLPTKLLCEVNSATKLNSLTYSQEQGVDHQKIIGAIKSLESLGDVSNSEARAIKGKEFNLNLCFGKFSSNGNSYSIFFYFLFINFLFFLL